jgi:hypothetical protein
MEPLQDFLNGLVFGEVTEFENLSMVPVMATQAPPEPGYMLLREAVEKKLARVTELGGGVVPELLFENLAGVPVLILGGEELVGAKQNRMVNLTILAAAQSKIVIPVSCVEAGRWHAVSHDLAPSDSVAFCTVRAGSTSQVTASMRLRVGRRTDQGGVWAAISELSDELDAHSGTGAMRAIFEQRLSDVEEFVRSLPYCAGQVGAAFLVEGQPAGIDVFDHPRTMETMRSALVRGYALHALAAQRRRKARGLAGGWADQEKAEADWAKRKVTQWLAAAGHGETIIEPAVGMGQDVRLENDTLTAAALWAEDHFVHFCAFPRDASAPGRGRLPVEPPEHDIILRSPPRRRRPASGHNTGEDA